MFVLRYSQILVVHPRGRCFSGVQVSGIGARGEGDGWQDCLPAWHRGDSVVVERLD